MARAIAVALCAVLIACGAAPAAVAPGSPGESPAPSPSPTLVPTPVATASATPSPTPLPTPDLASLGAAYLAAVEASNARNCAAYNMFHAAPNDLTNVKQGYADWATSDRQLADDLRPLAFPPAIQSLVDEMIIMLARSESAMIATASATTWEEYNANWPSADEWGLTISQQSNAIRGALGLPSVPASGC